MKATNHTTPLRKATDKTENSDTNIFSLDKLRIYKGCEHYTDVEAKTIINSLQKLSAICYDLLHNSNTNTIDNQQVVYLHPPQEIKLIAA